MSLAYDSEYDVLLMHVLTHEVKPEMWWVRDFYEMNDPCKWYKCNGECDHPLTFDDVESFLVPVEFDGLNEDGDPIYERI